MIRRLYWNLVRRKQTKYNGMINMFRMHAKWQRHISRVLEVDFDKISLLASLYLRTLQQPFGQLQPDWSVDQLCSLMFVIPLFKFSVNVFIIYLLR